MSSPPPMEPPRTASQSQLTFARLPRPQQVLNLNRPLNRPLVPTKSLLIQSQAGIKSAEKHLLAAVAPSRPRPTSSRAPHITTQQDAQVTSAKMITLGKFAQDNVE